MITKPIQIIVAVIAAFFAITLLTQISIQKRTAEGKIMVQACEDIKSHQTLRSKEDFDQIISAIYGHSHSYRDESDTVLARAVMQLRALKSESEFHNEYTPYYHKSFSEVLNRLSYLELEDALFLLQRNQENKAHLAITRAHHYLQDALYFSENPDYKQQKEAFEIIGGIENDELKESRIQAGINLIKGLI